MGAFLSSDFLNSKLFAMQKYKTKKRFGQHFLHDQSVIQKLVHEINPKSDEQIVEIGPGLGALTFPLLEKVDAISVVEIDRDVIKRLKEKNLDSLTIHEQDALTFNFDQLADDKGLRVVGNLPYNISTQILTQWIVDQKQFASIKKLILMFQKEVANRIIAKINSKNYGRLSIISNWKLNIKKEFDINPKSFFPKHKVDSTLLSFVPRKDFFHIKKPANLEKITRIFFNQRRKMIKNPLRQIFKYPDQIAEKLKLNINLRPQNLSLKNYFDITTEYENLNN